MNTKKIKKETILKKRNRRGTVRKKLSKKEIGIIAKRKIEDKNKLLTLKRGDKKLEVIEARVEETPEEKAEILSGLGLFNAAAVEEDTYNKKMAAAGLHYHAAEDIFLLTDEEVRGIYDGHRLANDIMDKYNYYKDEFDIEILSEREVENLPFFNIDYLKDLRSAFYTEEGESAGIRGRESEKKKITNKLAELEEKHSREIKNYGDAVKGQGSEKKEVKDRMKDKMKDRMKKRMKDNLHIKP